MTPQSTLDNHIRDIVRWHFSADTGTPFWLDLKKKLAFDPAKEINTYADLAKLPRFEDGWLRDLPHEVWIPRAYAGKPFKIFETGGTTGMPKQRISWEDHLTDYTEFSAGLDIDYPGAFPKGANWLMMGPTGPRRLRLSIEHLANLRGGSCYFLDLDPRWVKKVLASKQSAVAKQYMEHVTEQALEILKHRDVKCLFTTPRLLEALGEKLNVPEAGIKGVFCGGTSMTPQVIRFLLEEILENQAALVPTYGNTLMGLAVAYPISAKEQFALTYYAPQPRAVLRVVDGNHPDQLVDYGQWGRVELTTLTKEFFMPRFLERDEAVRRPAPATTPTGQPWRLQWDGVGDVRPLGWTSKPIVEGVY